MRPTTRVFGIPVPSLKAVALSITTLAGSPAIASAQQCTPRTLAAGAIQEAESVLNESFADQQADLKKYNKDNLPNFGRHIFIAAGCHAAMALVENQVIKEGGLHDATLQAKVDTVLNRNYDLNAQLYKCCP